MIKIAILGKANSGKNTLAKMITKEIRASLKPKLGLQSVAYIAFADPIKKIIQIMFPSLPKKFLYSSSKYRSQCIPGSFKDGQPLTVRQALMDLGTGLGRQYNDKIWIEAFEYSFNKNKDKDIIIIPDLRFRNEFNYLKSKGFFMIKIFRNSSSNINHISEIDQDQILDNEFDYILSNNASKSNLKSEVINIINKLNV